MSGFQSSGQDSAETILKRFINQSIGEEGQDSAETLKIFFLFINRTWWTTRRSGKDSAETINITINPPMRSYIMTTRRLRTGQRWNSFKNSIYTVHMIIHMLICTWNWTFGDFKVLDTLCLTLTLQVVKYLITLIPFSVWVSGHLEGLVQAALGNS